MTHETNNALSEPWCAVCCEDIGDSPAGSFPDGCVAHASCFASATSSEAAYHGVEQTTALQQTLPSPKEDR